MVPLVGEACVAVVSDGTAGFDSSKPPIVSIKIGDGTHTFAELPWAQAVAGDVYAWAKAATKPTYAANEISGLVDYISGEIQDTNTTYKIEQDSTERNKITLYSKAIGGAWTAESTIALPADYAAKAYETKVDTLIGSDAGKSVRTIANEELAAQLIPASAQEALDTLQEIAAWIQSHPGDAAEMHSKIVTLKDALSDFVTVNLDGTYSTTDNAVKNYVDTAIANADVSGKIATEINKLDSSVSATAADGNQYSVLTGVTEANGKLSSKTEVKLAAIAKTGNVNDLIQTSGDVIVLNCGSSTAVI